MLTRTQTHRRTLLSIIKLQFSRPPQVALVCGMLRFKTRYAFALRSTELCGESNTKLWTLFRSGNQIMFFYFTSEFLNAINFFAGRVFFGSSHRRVFLHQHFHNQQADLRFVCFDHNSSSFMTKRKCSIPFARGFLGQEAKANTLAELKSLRLN